jgi:hypothetical protein
MTVELLIPIGRLFKLIQGLLSNMFCLFTEIYRSLDEVILEQYW